MKKLLRVMGAVLAGYAAIGVLVVLTDRIFGLTIPNYRTLTALPPYYFAVVTGTDALYSVIGGYLCALIAGGFGMEATAGLMLLGEIAGIGSAVLSWQMQPHWFALGLLVLFPLGVWIGSRLRAGGKRSPAGAA
jgi:hypothetical protein